MGIRSWLSQAARTLKLAVKPGRSELWLSIKISILGMGVIGLVGYVIRILSFALGGATAAKISILGMGVVGLVGYVIRILSFALGGATAAG